MNSKLYTIVLPQNNRRKRIGNGMNFKNTQGHVSKQIIINVQCVIKNIGLIIILGICI